MAKSTRLLCILHLFGNAILLWIGYEWLNIGESSMLRLTESILLAIAIMLATLWLHGSALAHFGAEDRSKIGPAMGRALKHLLPLFVLSLFVVVIYVVLAQWDSSMEKTTGTLRTVSDVALWLLRWLIFPVVLLPLAGNVAAKGFRGYTAGAWQLTKSVLYWIEVVALLLVGIWVPLKIITWVPKLDGFALQFTSLVVRFLVAYLLFVVAWLLLESFTSGGKPRDSQVMTESAP